VERGRKKWGERYPCYIPFWQERKKGTSTLGRKEEGGNKKKRKNPSILQTPALFEEGKKRKGKGGFSHNEASASNFEQSTEKKRKIWVRGKGQPSLSSRGGKKKVKTPPTRGAEKRGNKRNTIYVSKSLYISESGEKERGDRKSVREYQKGETPLLFLAQKGKKKKRRSYRGGGNPATFFSSSVEKVERPTARPLRKKDISTYLCGEEGKDIAEGRKEKKKSPFLEEKKEREKGSQSSPRPSRKRGRVGIVLH